MPSAFNLRFEPLVPGPSTLLDEPPTLYLFAPSAGWIRWRIGDTAPAVIRMSALCSPLVSLWVWVAAIANDLLPVTLRIDEEGVFSELCAEDAGDGELWLTLRQVDVDEMDCIRFVWREARLDWLGHLGETFGEFLGESFDERAWCIGPGPWPEIARELPWCWPTWIAEPAISQREACPASARKILFFMQLTNFLTPWSLRRSWCPEDWERFARMRVSLALAGRKALYGAIAAASLEGAVQDDTATGSPSEVALDHRVQAARDLFEALERETGDIEPPELAAALADPRQRERVLHDVVYAVVSALNRLVDDMSPSLCAQLPLAPGLWLAGELGRLGCILQIDGQIDSPRLVIDWGEVGIGAESLYLCGRLGFWRRPIMPPPDFAFPDDPLFQRWRSFATWTQTSHYPICPCCGYPALEDESDEIQDCPLCGWPLWYVLNHPLPDPGQPLPTDPKSGQPIWPGLRESRRHFASHGDAFPIEETDQTGWLRRPDVVALRRHVIAGFDAWLADPAHPDHLLPEDDWTRLDWMPKTPEHSA